jgi:hypothetical protein
MAPVAGFDCRVAVSAARRPHDLPEHRLGPMRQTAMTAMI